MTALRIAVLTHSTNPRGGVAHCLALAEALCALGHEAVVHAPDPSGRGFFRPAACPMVSVAAKPVAGTTVDLVRARIDDYLRHFASPAACDFDVFHAHCGIGGNALATLKHRRLIPGFVRTVHHLDSFSDPVLADWQDRSIREATRLLCVSRAWADRIAGDLGTEIPVVGNGVDLSIYRAMPTEADAIVRARWGLGGGPIVLSVGGFEERKNTAGIIEAFALLRRRHPQAQLVVVGGASLLDHASYGALCRAALSAHGLVVGRGEAVIEPGRSLRRRCRPSIGRRTFSPFPPGRRASASACWRRWPAAFRRSSPAGRPSPSISGATTPSSSILAIPGTSPTP